MDLPTPPELQEQILKAYIANPGPVLWRDMFSKQPHESSEEALARCYPELLVARQRLYEQYADVTIDYYTRSQEDFGVSDFLKGVDDPSMKPRLGREDRSRPPATRYKS